MPSTASVRWAPKPSSPATARSAAPRCSTPSAATLASFATTPGEASKRARRRSKLAQSLDLGPYAGLCDTERIVGNLHRAYSELRGEPRGAALSLNTIFPEMVAYNGGQPLRCLA